VRLHGTLLEVEGVGVLVRGPSGVGKSETALELIRRGHRLVADDVVELRVEGGALLGTGPELIRHHVEIRGLGILYVPDLYGPESVRDACPVELCCRLEHWRPGAEYERVGLVRPSERLLGCDVPSLLLPVRPAGNMATLVEVAARDHRLRAAGVVAAHRLDARVREESRRP
jgi:HPr kinase/phosphorylase